MVAYLGFYLVQALGNTIVTSPALMTTITETASMSGIAVREEQVLSSDRAYVFVAAEDGAEVSKDAVLASAMDSEEALERAGRRRELQNEISRVETLLSGLTSADDLTERDAAVHKAVLDLSACIARGELGSADSAGVALSSLVFGTDGTAATQEDLAGLQAELSSLESGTWPDSEDITAPESGLFTTMLDGYEALTPDDLSGLNTTGLKALLNTQPASDDGAIGKLVTGWRWYFAALMKESDAESLTPGDYVNVTFGRHYSGRVSMRVESVSVANGGQCAVVFSSLHALADTLSMREADAEVVKSEETGLRVPLRAVHVDDEGRSFVYIASAGLVEVKYVEIEKDAGDYVLVAVSSDASGLREGNEIIVQGRNVYEGMVID